MMNDRPHWSFSAINQYLRCPLQFYFERILCLPRASTSSSLVFGSSVHHALAIYHDGIHKNREVKIEDLQNSIREKWSDQSEGKRIDYKDGEKPDLLIEQAITLVELYVQEPKPTNIVCVEKRMTVPLHNSDGYVLEKPLVAVADLVTCHEDKIHITELKTAAKAYSDFEIHSSLQATCYVNASQEMFGEMATVEYAVLVKTKTPKIQRMTTRRDENDLGRLGDLVETIQRAVDSQAFYPIESTMNCSTCAYRRECVEWKPMKASTGNGKPKFYNGVLECLPN